MENSAVANVKKLLLIINPVAGKGTAKAKLFEAVNIFSSHGYMVTVLPTTKERAETEEVIKNEAKSYDIIVAIGGDGTLNTVVNGIMKSGADIPLGYIPLGSTNDFGKTLGLTKNIAEGCKKIATGEPKYIDLGRIGERYFVYIACTGLFSEASYMTSQQLKNTLGHSAYILKGIDSLGKARKVKYRIEADDEVFEDEFVYVSVSNTLSVAGIVNYPKDIVAVDDGYLELTVIKAPNNIIVGTAIINDILSSNWNSEHFITRKVKRVAVTTESEAGWSHDGENGGKNNEVVIEVAERDLKFVY